MAGDALRERRRRPRGVRHQPPKPGLLWSGNKVYRVAKNGTRRELATILPDVDRQYVFIARLTNGKMSEPATWRECAAWIMERVQPKGAAAA